MGRAAHNAPVVVRSKSTDNVQARARALAQEAAPACAAVLAKAPVLHATLRATATVLAREHVTARARQAAPALAKAAAS